MIIRARRAAAVTSSARCAVTCRGNDAAARARPPGRSAGAPPRTLVRRHHRVLRRLHGPARCERGDSCLPGTAAPVRRHPGRGSVGIAGLPAGPGHPAGAGGPLVGPVRAQAGLPVRVRGIRRRVGGMRPGADTGGAHRAAGGAGCGGGHAAGQQRRPGEHLHAVWQTQEGAGSSGGRAGSRARDRPGSGRPAGRVGRLAVDLPDQRASRAGRGAGRGLPAAADPAPGRQAGLRPAGGDAARNGRGRAADHRLRTVWLWPAGLGSPGRRCWPRW